MLPITMSRRALLIFAEEAPLDLARRHLPAAALPLLALPALNAGADVHVFSSRTASARADRTLHLQRGRNFAERFENAIETLGALGYAEIVAVGRDCPELSANDIARAFEQLRGKRLVLGPDHRGGCYLIAFRAADRALLRGIRWKRNTDCAELTARAGAAVVALLPIKHDIDSWADLRLAARASQRIARLLAYLCACTGDFSFGFRQLIHEAARFIRLHGQIPPPAPAAA